jgi:pyridinium-3,5-biscarboxylic acid mononucleotide sulfurtransferase
LRDLGFRQFRVRLHDKLARIEISPDEMALAFSKDMAAKIAQRLKAAGFSYVALDLEGYRQGSLNETIAKANQAQAGQPDAAAVHTGT